MGIGGFLKDVADGARWIPIAGSWIGMGLDAAGVDTKGHEPVSHALEDNFLAPASKPIEKVMEGMNWTYDNLVSQPLSTAAIQGSIALGDGPENLLSAHDWSRAWQAANHISPGQMQQMTLGKQGAALNIASPLLGLGFMVGNKGVADRVRAARDSPLVYATPAEAYLPPGWEQLPEEEQQRILKEVGMPAVGNQYVEKLRRDSTFFKYASGASDFAVRWYLDPVVLAGKGAGLAREKFIVTSRPATGWSAEDLGRIMDSSRMAKARDFIWQNKDNPQTINNLSMFRKSPLGPRAGGIISQLKSPEEVNLFLRTTLGDVEARGRLELENAQAARRMNQDVGRLSTLELNIDRFTRKGMERYAKMLHSERDLLEMRISADEAMQSRYAAALDHFAELDALNLTRRSGAQAAARTRAQNAFRTGPALGTAGAEAGRLAKARIYADDFFGDSLTMVRSFKESNPNGLMAVNDLTPEALDELRAHIARIPGIGPKIRGDLLNRYLATTTEGERLRFLDELEGKAVLQLGKKHGFTYDESMDLYREYRSRITKGQEALRRYSAARMTVDGKERLVDEFLSTGDKLAVHPNLATKLAENHMLIDLGQLDKVLARNASDLKAFRTNSAGNSDWLIDGLDRTSEIWKFATLFRLGYIPRVLGDDLLGQVARLGAATMATRAGYGVKNLATNLFHYRPASHYEGEAATAREGAQFTEEEIAALQPQADAFRDKLNQRTEVYKRDAVIARDRARRARNKLNAMDPTADPAKFKAMQTLANRAERAAKSAQAKVTSHSPARHARLATMDDQLASLQSARGDLLAQAEAADSLRLKGFRQDTQLDRSVRAGGIELPAAFGGEQGEYFQKMISSDDSLRTLLQRNKQIIHNNLVKSSSHAKGGGAVSYPQNESMFVSSWHKAINHQIMQDPLGRMAVKGATAERMEQWLNKAPEGRAYRRRLGVTHDTSERIAQSVWHEVEEYMPQGSGIREAALKGEADIPYLTEMAKTGQRPLQVHTTQLGESLAGSNDLSRGVDRVMNWWYKWAASMPADRMSRHPLFNQAYEGHAKTLVSQELKQGAKVAQRDADRIAETARRLALRDTRKLVFDIAHRTDAAAALRFMSPFYAATTEAWQRWARIIADRPEVVGYSSIFFNAPMSWGVMQDQDGNRIGRDGKAMVWDEKTGKLVPTLVAKGDRRIVVRMPSFIAKGPLGKIYGMDPSGNWSISQDSMNMVTQGDPWFNPGTGPMVSIPVSLLVKDKPGQAELARHLGILPFGPTPGSIGETLVQQGSPPYLKNFFTAFDTSDERYQRIKLQIMQQAAYDHANKGKPMPSAKEIASRTRNYWLFSALSAWSQPFATQKPDKYQFFRDQYNALRRKDPLTADEEYLKRFGESHFVFAQATTENAGGVPATKRAVALEQKYADILAANPELGALIVGPEGNGPFSPEAYAYQLSTPLVPGGAEMQRRRLSADEAMKENQRRLGWTKWTQQMNRITAELHGRGLTSFQDEGAEDLKAEKQNYLRLYTEPYYPDGSTNPYYNEEWAKDFYTFDPKKYDRMVPGLTAVANSELADRPARSDLRMLRTYLQGRQALVQLLNSRGQQGEASTLKAKANEDLKRQWSYFVDGLVERDTSFGDLYHRYLSRDLGVDIDQTADEEQT